MTKKYRYIGNQIALPTIPCLGLSIHETLPKWPILDAFWRYLGDISATSCPLGLNLKYVIKVHLAYV